MSESNKTSNQYLQDLRTVAETLERPDGWGRGALQARWAVSEIERLRADHEQYSAWVSPQLERLGREMEANERLRAALTIETARADADA